VIEFFVSILLALVRELEHVFFTKITPMTLIATLRMKAMEIMPDQYKQGLGSLNYTLKRSVTGISEFHHQ
jgi:hypothetical protein